MSKPLQVLNINETTLPQAVDVDVTNLVEIYKVFIQLEMLCKQHGVSSLCANQVGVPWNLFVVRDKTGVRKLLNAKYEIINPNKQQGLVRFINAEVNRPKHYLLHFYNEIEATYSEFVGSSLVAKKERGELLWFQINVDILNGRYPPVNGVEYLVNGW